MIITLELKDDMEAWLLGNVALTGRDADYILKGLLAQGMLCFNSSAHPKTILYGSGFGALDFDRVLSNALQTAESNRAATANRRTGRRNVRSLP